ncbi:hypothetical protein EA438_05685 [Streptococcus dysgalactiae subsp. dysgalactiae]|nr:hypothetical protein [Streptococcus dysgalactiae subsp. dysgalactiae]
MSVKRVFSVILLLAIGIVIYQEYSSHQKNLEKRDDISLRRNNHLKSKSADIEAKETLEKSDQKVSPQVTEKIKNNIQTPISVFEVAKNQDDIVLSYDNKLSITSLTVAQTIKTMLLAGYHFEADSLNVYKSDETNVYQFTIDIQTDKKDRLTLTGNYVIATNQFEFVSVHGTPVNVVY